MEQNIRTTRTSFIIFLFLGFKLLKNESTWTFLWLWDIFINVWSCVGPPVTLTAGIILGFGLRRYNMSYRDVTFFAFPGELLMRMLQMLVLPLLVSSLITGIVKVNFNVIYSCVFEIQHKWKYIIMDFQSFFQGTALCNRNLDTLFPCIFWVVQIVSYSILYCHKIISCKKTDISHTCHY